MKKNISIVVILSSMTSGLLYSSEADTSLTEWVVYKLWKQVPQHSRRLHIAANKGSHLHIEKGTQVKDQWGIGPFNTEEAIEIDVVGTGDAVTISMQLQDQFEVTLTDKQVPIEQFAQEIQEEEKKTEDGYTQCSPMNPDDNSFSTHTRNGRSLTSVKNMRCTSHIPQNIWAALLQKVCK